jgi:micrococcal nuclease
VSQRQGVLLAWLGLVWVSPIAAQQRIACRVAHITDGDTFWARCPGDVKVRMLLIDAPERDQFPFGRDAKAQLAGLLPPKSRVTLELDLRRTDRYGRILAYAFGADGRMANEEMVRSGYATVLVYPPNVRYVERIRAAAAEARRANRGLWAKGGFACTPGQHRRRDC